MYLHKLKLYYKILLNRVDTYNEENISDREKYILDIRKAAEENGYIRADINITADTPIITLSTCIRGKENKRLLVVAVQQ